VITDVNASPSNKDFDQHFHSHPVGWMRVAAMLLWAATGIAGTERFDYDALGRLVRHIDSPGTVTEYVYDGVGNILEVRRSLEAGPPVVSTVLPASVRRGQSVRIALTGSRLSGARVATSDPELDISSLTAAATGVSFTLSASAAATLGARVFTVSTSTGHTIFSLLIAPQLPALSFAPSAVTLQAGQTQEVTLTLSNPDSVAHSLSLAIGNTAVASVSTASITLSPGQTSAVFSVSGIASGVTALNIGSPTLAPTAVGIYVSAPFTGESAAYAPLVGIFRVEAAGGGTSPIGPFTAPNVGVFRPEAVGGGTSVAGPFAAPNVGVFRPEVPGGGGSLIGPIVAPDVGVQRE
jgi:YD repeat-containing protein